MEECVDCGRILTECEADESDCGQVNWTVLIDLATQLAELSVTNEKGEEIVRTNVSTR
jgi:hypothetical protein